MKKKDIFPTLIIIAVIVVVLFLDSQRELKSEVCELCRKNEYPSKMHYVESAEEYVCHECFSIAVAKCKKCGSTMYVKRYGKAHVLCDGCEN